MMDDIRKYEAMAKFDLLAQERDWLEKQAQRLENTFRILENIDTAGAEPLVNVLSLGNVLREDEAKQPFSREELLALAPEQYNGYFQVPKTLD